MKKDRTFQRNGAPLVLVLVLSVLLVVSPVTWAGNGNIQKEIESSLMCQCGCSMVIVDCQCEWAEQARADIAEKLDAGMTKDEVIQSYVDIYGKKALSAPPKEGFDWVAWIIPFLALAAGGILLFFLLRRWVMVFQQRGRDTDEEDLTLEEQVKYEGKIEEELKKYF